MKAKRSRFLIYGLIDPRTRLIFYIGLSSTGMSRPKSHRRPSTQGSRCRDYVRALQKDGFDYEITVLEEVRNPTELPLSERRWIAYGKACGWPLTNATAGGEHGFRFRMPGIGVSDDDLRQARFVNLFNIACKHGEVVWALETAERLLSAELFEWFKATAVEHHLDFCCGLPPRLVCPCGQAEPLCDGVPLTEAVERMNGHLREMTKLRNSEASRERQWMLHLS